MAKKFLDSAGLAVVWEKVKAQDATNLQSAKDYTDSKIAEIPAAIEYKGDGTTITETPGDGEVTFSVGTIDQAKVNGLTAALAGKADTVHTHAIDDVTGLQDALDGKSDVGHTHVSANITDLQDKLDAKADKVHTHAIADLTDLNDGWDSLLKAAPDVATATDLSELEGRVGTAESKLTGIETGAQVNVIESITVNGEAVNVSGKVASIPNAAADTYGTITENRVKALAGEVAGSVYRVKGTKSTIGDVLAVGTAAVGDVYNVTSEFTLNSQKFPAGTNVVFVGPDEEGEPDPAQQTQWDALGGTVDLTPYETTAHATATYATKESVTTIGEQVDEIDGRLTTAEGEIDTLQSGIALKLDKSAFDEHVADRTKMHLPAVSEADNGKVLGVVDGNAGWATMSIPLAEGTTTAGIVKAADDSVTISAGTIKVEAMTTTEIEGICV